MIIRKIVLCFLSFLPLSLIAQKATLSGYVKDASNGEGLIGASIYIKELKVGNVTNTYGFYSLSVQPGEFTLVFSSSGFAKQERKVTFSGKSQTLNIEMQPESNELAEVKSWLRRLMKMCAVLKCRRIKLILKQYEKFQPY